MASAISDSGVSAGSSLHDSSSTFGFHATPLRGMKLAARMMAEHTENCILKRKEKNQIDKKKGRTSARNLPPNAPQRAVNVPVSRSIIVDDPAEEGAQNRVHDDIGRI
jgi:hypothetical protein